MFCILERKRNLAIAREVVHATWSTLKIVKGLYNRGTGLYQFWTLNG
jgi:hypothetical protein